MAFSIVMLLNDVSELSLKFVLLNEDVSELLLNYEKLLCTVILCYIT